MVGSGYTSWVNLFSQLSGTLINVAAVLLGSALGLLLGGRLPDRTQRTLLQTLSMVTLYIGLEMAGALNRVMGGRVPGVILALVGLAAGAVIGEALGLEERLTGLGETLRGRFRGGGALHRRVRGRQPAVLHRAADGGGRPSERPERRQQQLRAQECAGRHLVAGAGRRVRRRRGFQRPDGAADPGRHQPGGGRTGGRAAARSGPQCAEDRSLRAARHRGGRPDDPGHQLQPDAGGSGHGGPAGAGGKPVAWAGGGAGGVVGGEAGGVRGGSGGVRMLVETGAACMRKL